LDGLCGGAAVADGARQGVSELLVVRFEAADPVGGCFEAA